jgi:3-methylcrotonyl-CoA carboxylase alpha subunit
MPLFQKILIANRGEIAARLCRTFRKLGIASLAVYSEVDRHSFYVKQADAAVYLGKAPPLESYLNSKRLIEIAQEYQADAIHPGYGFLSENSLFAQACKDASLVFIGPSVEAIRQMGSKIESRTLMEKHGVPVVPGYNGTAQEFEFLVEQAQAIGFPVLIKASAGGGGKGMRICWKLEDVLPALTASRREALQAFGDPTLFLERYLEKARHLEVQILGDHWGNRVHLFERECSIQRRHQKIIEEAPSSALTPTQREYLGSLALQAAEAVQYSSAGTVEFIQDAQGQFYFLEMNTRIQVEHPVTEAITGLDLVELQIRIAQGEALPFTQKELSWKGHALECRLYAEDPQEQFLPCTGTLIDWAPQLQENSRLDTGVTQGENLSIFYDPLLAKWISYGRTREEATQKMICVLKNHSIGGVQTNRDFLIAVLQHPEWLKRNLHTHFIQNYFTPYLPTPPPPILWIAATFCRFHQRQEQRTLLPRLIPGFRNNPFRETEERFASDHGKGGKGGKGKAKDEGEEEIRYRVESSSRIHCTFRGIGWTVQAIAIEAPVFRLEINGHQQVFRYVETEDQLFVHSQEGALTLNKVPRFPSASSSEDFLSSYHAPMPGKVIQILVEKGQTVQKGEALLILEAMKMEHTVFALGEGSIQEIYFQVGELVPQGATLLLFTVVAEAKIS